jgi:hypothetical protein
MAYRPEGFFYGPRTWRQAPDPGMRVGDTERNQVAEALSEHYSAGRLDSTEFKERLDKAMAAKTRGDLTGLLSDLPLLAPPAPPPAPRRRRVAVWVAVAAFILFLSVPWRAAPGGWWWFPHIPWLLIGIIALVAWRGGRRHRLHRGAGSP